MPGITNRGSTRCWNAFLSGGYSKWKDQAGTTVTLSKFDAALLTNTSAVPTADTVKMSDAGIVEASFTGYARVSVPLDGVGWVTAQDDTNDKSTSTLQNCSFSITGGSPQTVSYLVILGVATGGDAEDSASAQIIWVFGMAPQTFTNPTTIIFQNGVFEGRNTSW